MSSRGPILVVATALGAAPALAADSPTHSGTLTAIDPVWYIGYVDSPLSRGDLRRDDFANVRITRQGKQLIAASIEGVRPAKD
jgi:hypothetical protein